MNTHDIELPTLPEPFTYTRPGNSEGALFHVGHMQAYARAAIEAAQPTVSVRSADELIAVIRGWLEQDNPAHYGDFEKRLVAIIDGEPDPADEELRRDAARLDWLADPSNKFGAVQLPRRAVMENLHCMRAAIDAAMEGLQ